MTLAIFGNILIDSEERVIRLKDSLYILKDAEVDEWVFNLRGDFAEQAKGVIENLLKKNLSIYTIKSDLGWLADSLIIAKKINSDYIMLFLEDHLCVSGVDKLNSVVKDMKDNDVDYIQYSFFHEGADLMSMENFSYLDSEMLRVYVYDEELHRRRLTRIKKLNLVCSSYIISMAGIFSRNLFHQVLTTRPRKPLWHKLTPFDFERGPDEISLLPYKRGFLKNELFTSIDDDHDLAGSCLISKGHYPNRAPREFLIKNNRVANNRSLSMILKYFRSFF